MARLLTLLVASWFVIVMPAVASAAPCAGFTDVDDSSGFCTSIAWMKNRAITLGCSATQYCPNDFVRRDQMAAFMYRLGFQNAFLTGGNAFGGTAVLGTTDDQPLDIHVNGNRAMRYEPDNVAPNVIGGEANNSVIGSAYGATIAGGGFSGSCAFDGVPRSCANLAGTSASVGGGVSNEASGAWSTIAGGSFNTASGTSSTIAGGLGNTASGSFSFAAGRRAKATTTGTFMWADSSNFDFAPSVNNFFGVRATGGIGLTVAINGTTGAVTQFCNYLPGYSGWSCTSDRNAKENFASVENSKILEKLMAMPVYTYNFKGADPRLRMLGPTAQDFHAAFGLGDSDTTIASGNIQGVAIAAIQGLNAKMEEREAALRTEVQAARSDLQVKNAEIVLLRSESANLKREMAELRVAVEVLMARTSPEGRVAQTR